MPLLAQSGNAQAQPAPHEQAPLLRVRDLSVRYPSDEGVEVHAIVGLSFSVRAGEGVGLFGASGCGKTTTALALLQVLPEGSRLSGSIQLRGRELSGQPERELRKIRGAEIAMVFQEPSLALNPVLRAGNQIAEVVRAHRDWSWRRCCEEAESLLETVRLPRAGNFFHAYPHQLSGGQRQRVMIAQALACQPSVLIADEPTASLDWAVQAEILDLLAELRDAFGMALLVISHDARVVARLASRVLVMERGRIIEERVEAAGVRVAPKELVGENSPRAGNEPILIARDLKKRYARRAESVMSRKPVIALDGVNLTLKRGSAVALVGDSGAGKSTLARCLALLERPDAGEIEISGVNPFALPPKDLRAFRPRVQMIFQDPAASLNPGMRAWEIVAEPLVVQARGGRLVQRERALGAMESVELPASLAERFPSELSGGQRQRLAIARALVLDPEFLIFDEAFSALDRPVQLELTRLLRELRSRRGLTYLFITHDLDLAAAAADEIVLLRDGRIATAHDSKRYLAGSSSYPGDAARETASDAAPALAGARKEAD